MASHGKNAFMSYRGCDYTPARNFAHTLTESGTFDSITIVPPERICRDQEVLLPYEYFELMEFITDSMCNCDSLIIFDSGSYWQSYWTQMEIRQWRRFSPNLTAHVTTSDIHGVFQIRNAIT